MRRTIAWLSALLLATSTACDRYAVRESTVLDRRTALEWTSRDYAEALDWEAADRHCRELPANDGRSWRLPEVSELNALYDRRFDEPCGDKRCHVDPAITLGSPYVWSVTTRGAGTRFYFDFAYGNSFSPGTGPQLVRRVLCVRSGKSSARAESTRAAPHDPTD